MERRMELEMGKSLKAIHHNVVPTLSIPLVYSLSLSLLCMVISTTKVDCRTIIKSASSPTHISNLFQ